VMVKPYLENINWTKGIDEKTGKPVDYDPNREVQLYAGTATPVPGAQTKKMCPSPSGGNNFWPSTYSARTKLIYIPALTACAEVTQDPKLSVKINDAFRGGTSAPLERYETELSAMDPLTGELRAKTRIPYPNYSGALSTAGGVVFSGFTDGTLMAFDETTMQALWQINVGVGFNAPPMTLEDLAAEFGVSRERVRQIEVRAFEKVQKAVKNRVAAMELPQAAPALPVH